MHHVEREVFRTVFRGHGSEDEVGIQVGRHGQREQGYRAGRRSHGPREPLSWLALERYALGELTESERAQVEQRLAQSEEDRACLQSILLDDTVMPALPVPRLVSAAERSAASTARRARRSWALSGGILAAAAALVFALLDDGAVPRSRTVYDGSKGGEVAIAVHGARQGGDARTFAEGDRFKLLVTCPEWLSGTLHVLMVPRRTALPPAGGRTSAGLRKFGALARCFRAHRRCAGRRMRHLGTGRYASRCGARAENADPEHRVRAARASRSRSRRDRERRAMPFGAYFTAMRNTARIHARRSRRRSHVDHHTQVHS